MELIPQPQTLPIPQYPPIVRDVSRDVSAYCHAIPKCYAADVVHGSRWRLLPCVIVMSLYVVLVLVLVGSATTTIYFTYYTATFYTSDIIQLENKKQ